MKSRVRCALLSLPLAAFLSGSGCAGSRAADGSGLVPKDFKACVRGGGRLDREAMICRIQMNQRREAAAYNYCMSNGGLNRAVGSVSGLRQGSDRGDVCTLTFTRELEEDLSAPAP